MTTFKKIENFITNYTTPVKGTYRFDTDHTRYFIAFIKEDDDLSPVSFSPECKKAIIYTFKRKLKKAGPYYKRAIELV